MTITSRHFLPFAALLVLMLLLPACRTGDKPDTAASADSTGATIAVQSAPVGVAPANATGGDAVEPQKTGTAAPAGELPVVLVHYFHVKIRCVTCIAMERATRDVLHAHFRNELDNGRVKLFVLNIDDDANKALAEKYQAAGSGLFITRVYQGRETTADLTADGFKYAGDNDGKFGALIKAKVAEFLK